eukprot:gb/GECG01009543.1/.p1 GENE.gb/GECG01009543.1/~~gb/GECG01009543.1/.p1  ORF type:complete len:290 (+),score=36.51 gb/GECG01009543.1/:1-870(+)
MDYLNPDNIPSKDIRMDSEDIRVDNDEAFKEQLKTKSERIRNEIGSSNKKDRYFLKRKLFIVQNLLKKFGRDARYIFLEEVRFRRCYCESGESPARRFLTKASADFFGHRNPEECLRSWYIDFFPRIRKNGDSGEFEKAFCEWWSKVATAPILLADNGLAMMAFCFDKSIYQIRKRLLHDLELDCRGSIRQISESTCGVTNTLLLTLGEVKSSVAGVHGDSAKDQLKERIMVLSKAFFADTTSSSNPKSVRATGYVFVNKSPMSAPYYEVIENLSDDPLIRIVMTVLHT